MTDRASPCQVRPTVTCARPPPDSVKITCSTVSPGSAARASATYLSLIHISAECAANPDFMLTVDDLKAWEAQYGRIPEGAFVAFRSDWYKKPNLDNPDENGVPHYPGWDKAAIQWLVEERNIGAIGHEPADTDPGFVTTKEGAYPYPGEQYILQVDRIQIEVMRNLDQVPPVGSLIVIGFPKLKDGTGFPTRCFAICPVD